MERTQDKNNQSQPPKNKKIDGLNGWEYVNPQNSQDDLPQPYRYINKLLQECILDQVYGKIFEIEKFKNDPNYEGHLKSLPPQGSFDISNITCVSKESSLHSTQSHNHVIAGDAMGNIMILDLNKKMRVAKKEIGNGRRITKIAISSRELSNDDSQSLQNVAILSHLDPCIQIYRYRLGENKLYCHYTILTTKQSQKDGSKSLPIGELPTDIQFSSYSQFLIITQYNGNILVYKIPDFAAVKVQEEDIKVQPIGRGNLKQQQSPQQKQQQIILENKTTSYSQQTVSQLDIKAVELTEVYYKIEFKGIKKEPKYADLIQQMKQQVNVQQVEQQAIIQPTKEDPKKKGNPPQKGTLNKIEESTTQLLEVETNFNLEEITIQQSDMGLDISNDFPTQKFRPECSFVNEPLGISQGSKTFNSMKVFDVVVGIVVAWSNTNLFESHKFQATNKYNLPEYIQTKLQQQMEKQTIPEQMGKQPTQPNLVALKDPPLPKFMAQIKTIKALYPISNLALSQSSQFLALGLMQGSIIVYELSSLQEKHYLDKHHARVTQLSFCDDWKLVSGGEDGSVHIYDILNQGKLIMKRTNQFRKGQSLNEENSKAAYLTQGIACLGISNSGVAVAIDNQHEVRLYDVCRGEKIAKLNAQQIMDDKKRQWSLWPKPVLACFRCLKSFFQLKQLEEIIIIADTFELKISKQEIQEQEKTWNKSTSIQIFKIFDNLINLFPALSNVYRRGIDKEKIFHLYYKIDSQSLRDPSFEVPTLAGNEQGQNLLPVPQDSKGQRGSRKTLYVKDNKNPERTQKSNSIQSTGGNNGQKDYLHKIKEEHPSHKFKQQSLVNSLHGSNVSDSNGDFNSSFRSQITGSSGKDRKSKIQKEIVLTKQMLHPEQFLLEREKVPVPKAINENEKVVEHCRERNSEKQVRAEKVNNQVSKLGATLAQQEEKRILQEKQKQLLATKTIKK